MQTLPHEPTPMSTHTGCPACGGTAIRLYRVGIRENRFWPVLDCQDCGLRFIPPPHADLKNYYADEYRRTHNHLKDRELSPAERFEVTRPLMERRIRDFRRHIPQAAAVLDVGCSCGFFMDALQAAGYTVHGCDYNSDDIDFAGRDLHLMVEVGGLEDIAASQWGCIAACHVLEHLTDPVEWLRLAHDRLAPGGYLYIECPNVNDALLSEYQIPAFQGWYYCEPHISYFSAEILQRLMEAAGFKTQIHFRQEYSLANAYHWMTQGEPMSDARVAQARMVPVGPMGTFFSEADDEYRKRLESLGTANLLIAVGRRKD